MSDVIRFEEQKLIGSPDQPKMRLKVYMRGELVKELMIFDIKRDLPTIKAFYERWEEAWFPDYMPINSESGIYKFKVL